MPEVEGAGVALGVAERGEGPPVLVIHGLASDAAAWAAPAEAIAAAGARAIAYDRRGYGASGSPEPYTATTVQEQGEDAAAVLEALGAAGALLCGEGFGALVALDLLVRRPGLATGAVLAEAPLLAFVPEATDVLSAQRERLEDALREGGPEHAVGVWLGEGAGEDELARARAAHRGFFADYAGQSSWSPSRRELRAIGVPVVVLTGARTPEHLTAASDALAELLPSAERRTDGDVVAAVAALLR
jgi:pimeloyl-ACP methyl ester carboxylesterase